MYSKAAGYFKLSQLISLCIYHIKATKNDLFQGKNADLFFISKKILDNPEKSCILYIEISLQQTFLIVSGAV